MADFFNVDISLGSVSACEETVSEAVAEPVAQAREYVENAAVAHAVERSWSAGDRQSEARSPEGPRRSQAQVRAADEE